MAGSKGKIALISGSCLVGLFLLVEAVSISEWSASTVPLIGRIGVIHYRDTWGDFNRVTMGINSGLLWCAGYQMSGAESHGEFGVWMHTYRER
ncbi:MAG: hypothetical protein H0W78_12490 [Planctomycetes bacterium]|nr:hypothetical protein [Planctomycetota bacterium]